MYVFPKNPTESDIISLAEHICEYQKALHCVATGVLLTEHDEMLLNIYVSSYTVHPRLKGWEFNEENFVEIAWAVKELLLDEYEKAMGKFSQNGGKLSAQANEKLAECDSTIDYLMKRLNAVVSLNKVMQE